MLTKYTAENSVSVKNANGTAENECENCGTWIAHWEKYSTYYHGKCSIDGCDNDATLGAHVLRPLAENEKYKTHPYIIPMCIAHNNKSSKETMKTKPKVDFVWANVAETCGK